MLTARPGRRHDERLKTILLATRLIAFDAPFVQEGGTERTQHCMKACRARKRADVIKNIDLYRLLGFSGDDCLLPFLRNRSFHRSNEPRPEVDSASTEHERRRN